MASGESANRPSDQQRDLYAVLGVARQAEHDRIRRAYIEAARRWHPDRHRDKEGAEAEKAELAMRRVNEAWAVLGNKERRAAYDREVIPRQPGTGPRPGMNTPSVVFM
ncbi:MAG: J domain-containing protein, partial [Actinomycetota bacterium]